MYIFVAHKKQPLSLLTALDTREFASNDVHNWGRKVKTRNEDELAHVVTLNCCGNFFVIALLFCLLSSKAVLVLLPRPWGLLDGLVLLHSGLGRL